MSVFITQIWFECRKSCLEKMEVLTDERMMVGGGDVASTGSLLSPESCNDRFPSALIEAAQSEASHQTFVSPEPGGCLGGCVF